MKGKKGKIFAIVMFSGFLIYQLVSGIADLANRKDLHTVRLSSAVEVLQVEHSINWLIPTGTDYYYIGVAVDSEDAYLIHAPRNWLKKNFDSNLMAVTPGGVKITALAKKISDYKVADELYARAMQIEWAEYPLGTGYCLEVSYRLMAFLKLALFALSLGLFLSGVYLVRNKNTINKKFMILFIGASCAALVLMLIVIR